MGGLNPLGIIGMLARFGWKGILIGVVIVGFLLYSGGGGGMCAGGGAPAQPSSPGAKETGSTSEDELTRFVGFVFDDAQTSWKRELPDYQDARLVVFRGAVESACGTTSAAVGPFYCPGDKRVYIDLSFYQELARRFGAPGDFAQAYVIAHEIGHHIQNQRGSLRSGGSNQDSVEVELQADCLAGVWARSAETRGLLEVGDVEEALGAASAIGDDKIQEKTQGRVQPESWTHGSAAQRNAAFNKGYRGGSARNCGL